MTKIITSGQDMVKIGTYYWTAESGRTNNNIHGIAEIKLGSDFGIETSASLRVNAVNDAPELTGKQATLAKGKEDNAYILKDSDLLKDSQIPMVTRCRWTICKLLLAH